MSSSFVLNIDLFGVEALFVREKNVSCRLSKSKMHLNPPKKDQQKCVCECSQQHDSIAKRWN